MSTKKDWKAVCFDPLCEVRNPQAMSDQPKPTGEWTYEKVAQLLGMSEERASNYNLVVLRDSINAALASEQEKVQTYEGALIKIANDPNCDRCQVAVDALAKVAK